MSVGQSNKLSAADRIYRMLVRFGSASVSFLLGSLGFRQNNEAQAASTTNGSEGIDKDKYREVTLKYSERMKNKLWEGMQK